MKLYMNLYSGENDVHNLQFTVNARTHEQAIIKAERVAEVYKSGYELHSIECTTKPSVHTIANIAPFHMTVALNGSVHGRLFARMANVHGQGWLQGSSVTLTK